ncbi:MAG: hypothetical protein ACQES9_13930 [Myxococcota bacterium]
MTLPNVDEQFPGLPDNYRGPLVTASIMDPELSTNQTIVKQITVEPAYNSKYILSGIKTWQNKVYIYGNYEPQTSLGFIWRLNLE